MNKLSLTEQKELDNLMDIVKNLAGEDILIGYRSASAYKNQSYYWCLVRIDEILNRKPPVIKWSDFMPDGIKPGEMTIMVGRGSGKSMIGSILKRRSTTG